MTKKQEFEKTKEQESEKTKEQEFEKTKEQESEKTKEQESEKIETADVAKDGIAPAKTVTELKDEIAALNQQLQERNIENMQLNGNAKLLEQFENLKTIKVFLECVLLARDVSKEFGQKVELLSHLTPVSLKVEPKN